MAETETVRILAEERDYLVCEKPVGTESQDGEGKDYLPCLLRKQTDREYIGVVHRLDKVTGGAMLYALMPEATATLTSRLQSGEVVKEYLAVVHGIPTPVEATLTDELYRDKIKNKTYVVNRPRKGTKTATLQYRVLGSAETDRGMLSLLHIRLQTGRTHQIRAQLAARKHPLCGDGKYGSKDNRTTAALWSCALTVGKKRYVSLPDREVYPWNLLMDFYKSEG